MNKDRDQPTIEPLAERVDGGVAEAVDGRDGTELDGDWPYRSPSCLLKLSYT